MLTSLKFFLRHFCYWKNETPKRTSLACGVSIIHSCASQWDVMMSDCPHQKQSLLFSSSCLLPVCLSCLPLSVCSLLSSREMRQTTPPSPLLLLTSSQRQQRKTGHRNKPLLEVNVARYMADTWQLTQLAVQNYVAGYGHCCFLLSNKCQLFAHICCCCFSFCWLMYANRLNCVHGVLVISSSHSCMYRERLELQQFLIFMKIK